MRDTQPKATASPDNNNHDDKSKSQQGSSSSSSTAAAPAAAADNHAPSSTSEANPPTNVPTPTPPPQQAIGYPPVIGYPPNGQQPYPPYNSYPYGGPPPPPQSYYPSNTYPHSQQGINSSGFARGLLTALITIVILSCMASIITYLVLRPEAPVFRVVNFSTSNFNISNSVLMGDWSTELAVSNPNDKLTAYFYRINSFVYYRDPKNYLAYNTESPFALNTNENGTMKVKLTMINSDQPPDGVIAELSKERATGTVSFGFGMGMLGTFRSGSWWSNHVSMRVYCDDLRVGFVGATGTGNLLPSNDKNINRQCVVYT